ncbi:DUF4407 domain-containing protein [Ascidiimonas sp. W6]|uniref:DUF4407 domain-containing protein n=1 Tax=Ascidiimonas meishanensis TaxID=3128903 RepID=UPI0030EEB713
MLKRFFIICSGADLELLDNCSNGEQNKYAGIGATVFFTAMMAFIAGSYALYTVFDNSYIAISFGLIWGLLIFNLDRFIVSTIRKKDSFRSELIQATPRIILAVIIAVVISKPLELKIFEKEINQVLLEEKNQMTLENKGQIAAQYTPRITNLKQEVATLQGQIVSKEAEVNTLYETFITEAEGTSGTFKLGKGPVYQEKREKHDAALAELQNLRLENLQKIKAKELELASINNTFNEKVLKTQPIIDGFDGLMARINALSKLPWLPSFFIFLLFLAIETSPIIAKLLTDRGVYDMKLEDYENTVKANVTQRNKERASMTEAGFVINDKIYKDITEDSELYDYKKQKSKAVLQMQADAFYDRQKNSL